ncbi:hypothetical protein DV515_00007028 [Chloebia gouldiae]|uniref:Uncharacterized protein n=1 Tax=Chloebia gouldiae TaxID=44316 RepID=A0A3L8SJF7_CHLGU|nr:hypothetical protein DV515_00007028 [Chloebia gouldiae]
MLKRSNPCAFSLGRTSNWTKAGACGGNSRNSWGCELHFDRIHDIYWARVRVVAGGEQSEWAGSSELQLYRDTIVGPPKLSLLLQDQILSVNITTPLTPYKRRTGSYKRVNQVLLKLWYWLHLYEGELLVQQVCVVAGQGPDVQDLHKLSWCSKATISGCSGAGVPVLQAWLCMQV